MLEYKIQVRLDCCALTMCASKPSVMDTLIARMDASLRHLSTQRNLYAEISRARDWTEHVTNDRWALQDPVEGVTGERIAALEAVEPG